MKKELVCAAAFLAVAGVSCSGNKTEQATDNGINPANMDLKAVPGDNFYEYADGGWIASHPLKPEYARFGIFDQLQEESRQHVRELIEEAAKKDNPAGSIAQKIGDYYNLAMDSTRRNKEGAAPLKPYLEQVNKLSDKKGLTTLLALMASHGDSPLFNFYVGADERNSHLNVFHLEQGGFAMGDRDYYFAKDEHTVMLRTTYTATIQKLFTLAGYNAKEAQAASDAVMRIESDLAKIASSRVELRDPVANYHKISLADLKKLSPEIDWPLFFKDLGIKGLSDLNVGQPAPIGEVSKLIQKTPLQDLKYYLCWNIINDAAPYLSDAFSETRFEYYGKALSGRQIQSERWKRAVGAVDAAMGEATGQLYVAKYFPPAAKERMMTLVKNLQTALGERIRALAWMGDSTKAKAEAKLAAFRIKIGYPDKWRDYSALKVDKSKSFLDNVIAANNFEFNYDMNKFNKPVDPTEWGMTPQTVNAYYNPTTNEICFPAAILQPPFFNMKADDAVNYGGIGVVIGHEMTHGFDDEGRQFDKDGNLSDWWTPEDAAKFKARAKVLADFFSNIIVEDTVHGNGELTLGENIADQGGLHVSWQAYQNTLKGKPQPAPIGGFTNAQRFFLSYATVWAQRIRPAEILRR
ncbi:MAG: M13 family metallopeptidase, partial [Tannerella sp.]|nr:M13 family metallopeptidase [Tannerella sp.]